MDWAEATGIFFLAASLGAGCYEKPSDANDGTGTDTGTDTGSTTSTDTSTTADSTSTTGDTTTTGTSTTDPDTTATGSTGASDTGTTGEPVEPSQIFYINFEGPTLTAGATDDARQNVTQLGVDYALEYDPYGGGSQQQAVFARVVEQLSPFNVAIVDMRPLEGDYTMIVVSPTNPVGQGVIAISSEVDCDNENPNNISFAFLSTTDSFTLDQHANAIAGQIGLSVGLDRLNEDTADEIMAPFLEDEPREFRDMCFELRPPPQAVCLSNHEAVCGDDSNQQNSYQELLALFGPA